MYIICCIHDFLHQDGLWNSIEWHLNSSIVFHVWILTMKYITGNVLIAEIYLIDYILSYKFIYNIIKFLVLQLLPYPSGTFIAHQFL